MLGVTSVLDTQGNHSTHSETRQYVGNKEGWQEPVDHAVAPQVERGKDAYERCAHSDEAKKNQIPDGPSSDAHLAPLGRDGRVARQRCALRAASLA